MIMTHKDPDADGIGSMLALGKVLLNENKDVVLFTDEPVHSPVNLLIGYERIVHHVAFERDFDVVITLDCGDRKRVGGPYRDVDCNATVINIDHHESHDLFGDLNLADSNSSSTAELVYRVIKDAGFSIDYDIADNIFTAIQADTGSFKYENTSPETFKIAAEMMEYGVEPQQISTRMMEEYSLAKIKLLEIALGEVEFYNEGRIGMVILSSDMFEKAQARLEDSGNFIDYLRDVSGVELAVLALEKGENIYKFSMRSNNKVNVATLASFFGGGGHAKAAGFECHNSKGTLKKDFLKQAGRLLGDISN